MSPVEEGAYLPPDEQTAGGRWFRLYLRLAYRVWRRLLRRYLRHYHGVRAPRVLDCGCGPGLLLGFLREWFDGLNLVGMDMDRLSLAYARRQMPGLALVRGSASGTVLPVADRSCDVVFALHVVEHLEEPDGFLREARRILPPGGVLMLATPNPSGWGARYMGEKWKGIRSDHVSLRAPDAWRDAIRKAGFRIERDGTTTVSGIPLMQRMPFALLHWLPLLVFGFFPWKHGEAYICVARAEP